MGSSPISGMSFSRVRTRGWRAQVGRKNSQPMAGGGTSEAPGRLPCSAGRHRGATYERSVLKHNGGLLSRRPRADSIRDCWIQGPEREPLHREAGARRCAGRKSGDKRQGGF